MTQLINPMGYIEEKTQEGRVPILTTNATDAKADPMGYLYAEREVNGTVGRTPIVRIDGASGGNAATPSLEQVASVGNQTTLPLSAAPAEKEEQLATLGQVQQLIPASLPANGGNADTVDGKHAADFAKDSLALQYRGGVPDGADVNSYQENGFYWTGGNPTGKPSGMGTIANSFIENGRYGSRIFSSLDDGGKLHFQTTNDYQKSSWREIFHTGNLNPANFVPSTLGYGGKTTVATGSLFDYLNKSQLISGIGLTNAPNGSEWFIYNIVAHQPSKHVVVVATAISNTFNHTDTYIGVMDESEWKGWSRVWTSKNLTPLAMDKAALTSNVNANLIKEPGVYAIAIGNGTGNTNFPMANAYGTLTVVKCDDFYTQVAAHTSPYQFTYTRTGYLPSGNTDSWGEWQLVYTDKSFSAANSELLEKTYYIQENNPGILIKTRRKDTEEFMGVVRITGNSYNDKKIIDTKLQFYAYPAGASIINYAATNVGLPIAKINIFFIDSYLHIWLPPFTNYNTLKVFVSDHKSNANLVDTITPSTMPSVPKRLVTVIPGNVLTDTNLNPANFAAAAQEAMADAALVRDPSASIKVEDTAKTMCGFGYAGNGFSTTGSFISFGGFFNDKYQTQLQGDYISGNELFFRTKYDDQPNRWNPWRKVWHSGNFDPNTVALTKTTWYPYLTSSAAYIPNKSCQSTSFGKLTLLNVYLELSADNLSASNQYDAVQIKGFPVPPEANSTLYRTEVDTNLSFSIYSEVKSIIAILHRSGSNTYLQLYKRIQGRLESLTYKDISTISVDTQFVFQLTYLAP